MKGEQTIQDSVEEVVRDVLELPGAATEVDPEAPLASVFPELDSLAILELVTALERRFGIVVEDEDLAAEAFDSLASLSVFVESKLSA